MNYKIDNLVFKGGGVLGIAYAGAIKALEEKNLLGYIERVAGTSAGAITATLVSLKYKADEITKIVNETDFKSFEDGNIITDTLHFFGRFGFFKGDAFLTWMKTQIHNKGLSETATFADFKAAGCLDLHVFASDLNIKDLREFSFAKTPNVPVAFAVRASMSIPFFFEAWQFPNNNPDDHIYVDGGMIFNYPLTIFDTLETINPNTLGLFLSNLSESTNIDNNLEEHHFIKFIGDTLDTMLNAQVVDFKNDPSEQKRSIIIDNLGISPTNFKLTDINKSALFKSGYNYTSLFLERQN